MITHCPICFSQLVSHDRSSYSLVCFAKYEEHVFSWHPNDKKHNIVIREGDSNQPMIWFTIVSQEINWVNCDSLGKLSPYKHIFHSVGDLLAHYRAGLQSLLFI